MTAAPIPLEIPDGDTLRQLREEIGLSQYDLAEELGFRPINGAQIIRAWEAGVRNGAPCHPTPLAWRCFRLLVMSCRACCMPAPDAREYIRAHLSDGVK